MLKRTEGHTNLFLSILEFCSQTPRCSPRYYPACNSLTHIQLYFVEKYKSSLLLLRICFSLHRFSLYNPKVLLMEAQKNFCNRAQDILTTSLARPPLPSKKKYIYFFALSTGYVTYKQNYCNSTKLT